MENGGATIFGIIVWAVFAAFYGLSRLFVESLEDPFGWPILLSVLAVWICLRLPTLFFIRAMILATGLFAIWYSFGLIPL